MELWILGGYSRNFGFGLRTKSWNFGFWGGIPGTMDLDLGQKKILGTTDLDLGQKVGTLDFGGVFREGDEKKKKKLQKIDLINLE